MGGVECSWGDDGCGGSPLEIHGAQLRFPPSIEWNSDDHSRYNHNSPERPPNDRSN
jgi:hypothetical protein